MLTEVLQRLEYNARQKVASDFPAFTNVGSNISRWSLHRIVGED